jgi:phosphoribosylaminoimidazole-succinocarboxamide synthase
MYTVHFSPPIILYGIENYALRKKDKKRLTSLKMRNFRTAGYTLLDRKRNEASFEEFKIEPVDEKRRRYKSKLSTTCNKSGQQQDYHNNAELYAKWTKTTWKTFEETIRRGRNRSTKA